MILIAFLGRIWALVVTPSSRHLARIAHDVAKWIKPGLSSGAPSGSSGNREMMIEKNSPPAASLLARYPNDA
ncbi:hypothetical protein [Herbidospora yilanensis]|uniref:hypothetical protein n=1 Tax=Herbidospora yilanensis TaxID=354426 RepID=UPI0012F771B2|nr:hypothetical protein [Herbidospora yilanensis]